MTDFASFADLLRADKDFFGLIEEHKNIGKKTTFKIGGTARLFIEPNDEKSLETLLFYIKQNEMRFFILGGGSNIVFCDEEFSGIVISTSRLSSLTYTQSDLGEEVFVECGSGVSIAKLVSYCTENNFWGMQEFSGLPGTVGGAIFMNARCFSKEISDVLEDVYAINTEIKLSKESFSEQKYAHEASLWDYKKSPFQDGTKIITKATFKLLKKDSTLHNLLVEENKKYIAERKDKGHFEFPSAGSVFRNNHEFGEPSGKIIDRCGLNGVSYGGAQIAPFHGNFIINKGGATQKDVKALVEFVVNEVKKKTGFVLQPEIIFIEENSKSGSF